MDLFRSLPERAADLRRGAVRALAVAILALLALGSEARAAQTGFRAQDGEVDVSSADIASGRFGARRDSIRGWRNWGTASPSEVSALASSDDQRYRTWDPGRGDNAAMLFEYVFDDDPDSLSRIDVSIEIAQASNEDAIYIYLWDYDAGAYDVLGQMSGTQDQALSYSLTSDPGRYLSATGQLTLFLVNQDDYGSQASIYVDDLDVSLTSSLSHFAILLDGNASTCGVEPITISKHDAAHAVETGYLGTIAVDTSSGEGSWSLIQGDGAFDDGGGGTATYSFASTDAGSVRLGLVHNRAATLDLAVTDGLHREIRSEDPSLTFGGPGSEEVFDRFDDYSYAGNNGSTSWTGPWREIGESNGALLPYASISANRCVSGRCLHVGTPLSSQTSFTNRGVEREANLAGATSATLSFSYLRAHSRGNGSASVAVSSDGGASYTTLATYKLNKRTTTPTYQSFDITPYISATTRIRFLASTRNAITAIYFDDIRIDYETTCPANDYFAISHDGQGAHCQPEPFEVTAMTAGDIPLVDYSETITLTTGVGIGTFASVATNQGVFSDPVADDGLASYTFADADDGRARFTLDFSGGTGGGGEASVDIDVREIARPSTLDDDREGLLHFGPSAFQLTASALPNPPPDPIIDPIGSRVAATTFDIHLAAHGSAGGGCGIIESYAGSKSLSFWSEYSDPASGTRSLLVENAPVGRSEATATLRNVEFIAGQARVRARYKDVGRIQLHVLDANAGSTTAGIRGASDAFVSLPADFEIFDVERPDGSPNPAVAEPTGDVFVRAGEPFRARVRVLDADGDPTPNFGREASPEGLRLFSSTLVAPAGGRNGSLDDGSLENATTLASDGSAGTFVGTAFAFDEVGAIRLAARVADGDYLGAGDIVGRDSEIVGRFTPSRFEVVPNAPEWGTACPLGAFSWAGQPLRYTSGRAPMLEVAAVNLAGGLTTNYSGDWLRLTHDSLGPRSYAISQGGFDLSGLPGADVDPTVAQTGPGRARIQFASGFGLAVARTPPLAPFDAEIELSIDVLDLDDVAYAANPIRFGGTAPGSGIAFDVSKRIQFGRLRFDNAFGSEFVDLPMRLVAQRFDGRAFVDDDNDSCSRISEANLVLTPTPGSLVVTPALAHQPLLSGDSGLALTAPNQIGSLEIVVDLGPGGANLPWLRFDWPRDGNLDGVLDDDPAAQATFGIWSGRDGMIYQREVY